jgi:hypothetical protein
MFDLTKDNKVHIDPIVLAIPAFQTVWDKDTDKDKATAYKELSYIFYVCDFKSPYAVFPRKQREAEVKKDIVKITGWKADKEVLAAVKSYEKLQTTPTIKLYEAAKETIGKLTDYLNSIDFTRKKDGKAIFQAKDVLTNLQKIGGVIDSLSKIEQKVMKEMSDDSKIRGGGRIGSRER